VNSLYFLEQTAVNVADCSNRGDYLSLYIEIDRCIKLSESAFTYEYVTQTVVNSSYSTINQFACVGGTSCPSNCSDVGNIVEGCTVQGTDSIFYGTTATSVVHAPIILASYGFDSTCSLPSLQDVESIGTGYSFGSNGVCVGGQKFECSGNDILISVCSSDCVTGCTLNSTAPNGGCWNDFFNIGSYYKIACGSFDMTTGTIPPAQLTPAQICAASNQADWTFGSGYYCNNGGFVQCWASGNGAIQCPAGTSCQCAPGVECSNHGTTSPCTTSK